MGKLKGWLNSARDALVPAATNRLDGAADALRDSASKAVIPGEGRLIRKDGGVAADPTSTKGHAFEHTQVATFNANAQVQGKPLLAIRIPPGGANEINEKFGLSLPTERLGEHDIIVINTENGNILQTYQAKTGNPSTVKDAINNPKYEKTDIILTTSDNTELASEYDNVSTVIDVGGVSSLPVSNELCTEIAKNPELAETLTNIASGAAEIVGGAVVGGSIAAAMASLTEAIKILGAAYRGEEVDKDLLVRALKQVFEAAKTGALRGALVKVLQIILDSQQGSNLPVVIVSVGLEVYPVILAYFKDEISFEEMIKTCGVKAVSNAVVVIICMTYPPLGLSLMGLSILSTVWKEFELGDVLAEHISDIPHIETLLAMVDLTKERGAYAVAVGKDIALQTSSEVRDKSILVAGHTRRQAGVAYSSLREGADKLNSATRAGISSASEFIVKKASCAKEELANRATGIKASLEDKKQAQKTE